MRHKLVFFYLALLLIGDTVNAYGRFKQEVKLVQCLCTAERPLRMQRIQCLGHYSDFTKSGFQFDRIVQYCGYFADKTKFGYYTGKNRLQMEGYNPFGSEPDLHTDTTCSFTKYTPGVPAPPHIRYATAKGWIIAKCIMNMANMNAFIGDWSYRYCCT